MTTIRRFTAWLLALALVSTAAHAGQESGQPTPEQMKVIVAEAIDEAIAELVRRGPHVADWNKQGVDIAAEVAARPGGTAANSLFMIDESGEPSVRLYTSKAAQSLVPADWTRMTRIGNVDAPAEGSSLEFSEIDDGYYAVVRVSEQRVGNGYCTRGLVGADLYRAPLKPDQTVDEEMTAEVMEVVFENAVVGFAKHTICTRYDRAGETFKARYFDEEGHSLPELDDEEGEISIVAARPIGEMLARP